MLFGKKILITTTCFVCFVESKEVESEQMGTPVDWMVFDLATTTADAEKKKSPQKYVSNYLKLCSSDASPWCVAAVFYCAYFPGQHSALCQWALFFSDCFRLLWKIVLSCAAEMWWKSCRP